MKSRITELLGIEHPIVQGGMIWCSGWELVSAVSNSGGLGLLGAGSMYPEILREHIQKCKKATNKPFGVNLPLIYPDIDKHIQIIVEEGVKIVFTSAGSPKKYTSFFKEHGITVVHVVSNVKFAKKCEEAGVDAIVAEGYEAGGHNGIEENTTMTLIPQVRASVTIPVIAAGGIATGAGLVAALALGADGVQIGTRFVASEEASAHINFKQAVIDAKDGDTMVMFKKIIPARMLRNKYFDKVKHVEDTTNNIEDLKNIMGKALAKKGMFEGDVEEGKLEIGQIAALIDKIEPAETIINNIICEAENVIKRLS